MPCHDDEAGFREISRPNDTRLKTDARKKTIAQRATGWNRSRTLGTAGFGPGQIIRRGVRKVSVRTERVWTGIILIGRYNSPAPFIILRMAVKKGPGGTAIMAGGRKIPPYWIHISRL